jgi:hypothetical protein
MPNGCVVNVRYFNAGPCELRLGVYESFDTLCIYLESDSLAGDTERNFWVKYRYAIVRLPRFLLAVLCCRSAESWGDDGMM